MRLAIELYDTHIGELTGTGRSADFTPSVAGIQKFGANSMVLSASIPLTTTMPKNRSARRRNWFEELLPEGDQYEYMLQQSGLRRGDTLSFLAHYGRDIAGALQIWDLDDPSEPHTPQLRRLDASEIRTLLEDPIGSPLANDEHVGKSSLSGVQPKIVLTRQDTGWAQARGGAATTHIFKPALEGRNSTVIYDEEYGARLARGLSLANHDTRIVEFDGLPALQIERFDRIDGTRIHQEDFNQVLGAHGNEKYQELGGVVSLARVAASLQKITAGTELTRFARMVVLSTACGNLDMHTKNLGLLHPADGGITLAPAYDVVPQTHQKNDGKMALAIAGKYRHVEITGEDLRTEISSWGLRKAATLVEQTLQELDALTQTEQPLPQAHAEVYGATRETITRLLNS